MKKPLGFDVSTLVRVSFSRAAELPRWDSSISQFASFQTNFVPTWLWFECFVPIGWWLFWSFSPVLPLVFHMELSGHDDDYSLSKIVKILNSIVDDFNSQPKGSQGLPSLLWVNCRRIEFVNQAVFPTFISLRFQFFIEREEALCVERWEDQREQTIFSGQRRRETCWQDNTCDVFSPWLLFVCLLFVIFLRDSDNWGAEVESKDFIPTRMSSSKCQSEHESA